MNTVKHTQQGFTLIELMIVVAIIGILAAVAVPAYQDYVARAQATEAVVLAEGVKTSVAENFMQNASCIDNSAAAVGGVSLATDIKGNTVLSVTTGGTYATTGGCTIVAKMKASGINPGLTSKSVQLKLSGADKGSMIWTCTSDANEKYMPKQCQSGGAL